MKPVTLVAVVVFALIAVLQLLRLIMSWEITVQGVLVPVWTSGIALVIAAGMAIMLGREARG